MRLLLLFTLTALLLAACAGTQAADTPSGPRTIRLMSHDSFAVNEDVIKEFEAAHDARVELLPSGDAGASTQSGDPEQRQSPGRRVFRRRQYLSQPGPESRNLCAIRVASLGKCSR